jgi:sugar O-acyltransferase (sialic acid O-acetyltransferase NeuD family)
MIEHAIIGAGGFGREIKAAMGIPDIKFFVDDKYEDLNNNILGLSKFDPKKYIVVVAVADSKDRADIVAKLPKETKYFTFIHPSVHIMDDNIQVGVGSFIGANSILTTNIKLGNHALLNRGNHIGHDSVAGDFFSMMPNAVVGGNVTLGDNVYLGSCSNVREKINITSDVLIGMNAAVVKDITESGTYVGVPAKKM